MGETPGEARHRLRDGAAIVALALALALAYAVTLDQITARIALSYFTIGHAPLVADPTPTRVALAWAIRAGTPVGLALGIVLALAAQAGARPPLRPLALLRPLLFAVIGVAGAAALGGLAAGAGARSGVLRLPEAIAAQIETPGHAGFLVAFGATAASYAAATLAAIVLAVAAWRARRGRPRRDVLGALLFHGGLAGMAVVLVGPFALAWATSSLLVHPPWSADATVVPLAEVRASLTRPPEVVSFPGPAGATLHGWLFAPPPERDRHTVVLLAGGGWSDRRSLLQLVPPLEEAGFTVLAFDWRGAGSVRGRTATYGVEESEDLLAAVDFVQARGFGRVAVIGYSMGGVAAIRAAARDPRIGAVVAFTPGTSLGDLLSRLPATARAPAWLRELVARAVLLRTGAGGACAREPDAGPIYDAPALAGRPLLVVQGQGDVVTPADAGRRLVARAGPSATLLLLEGAGHLDLLDGGDGRVPREILRFLEGAWDAEAPGRGPLELAPRAEGDIPLHRRAGW